MLQDILTDLARAPLWAQVAMALFAGVFVYSVVSPYFTTRHYASRFAKIARELGHDVGRRRKWPLSFSTTVNGRMFEIRYDYASSRSSADRGPGGHVLMASTRLSEAGWQVHHVDIQRGGGWLRKIAKDTAVKTGDADFDLRFFVREQGNRVREGWLDAPTRAAVQHFYDNPAAQEPLAIQAQRVLYSVAAPWKGIDGPTLRSLLERQAALASALDTTAGASV